MFAKILFPTDFSAYANTVFSCLPDLKKVGLHTVVLLHVIRESGVPMPEETRRADVKRVEWSAKEELNIAQMALQGQGIHVVTCVEYGSPVEQILRVAEEECVSLILMGAQGKTLSEELLVGSVTYEVARRASIPVLIQKAQTVREMGHIECQAVCEQIFTRVLHPTDFSDCANAAFQLIKRLKNAGTKEVVLLHVQDERVMRQRSAEQLADFDREDTERLEKLYRALRLFGFEARFMLRHGHPVAETLKAADEVNPSLIVLGSRGRSAFREMLSGSTFENIMRLSHHPVLTTKCVQCQ
ncbi:MAG: universal stress protein [Chloroflexi bacterium]|nr:universal stress protein [Chloroflexota bacterium]MDL1885447.1 universal stress protein [Anaerolineae bacterium CFX8]